MVLFEFQRFLNLTWKNVTMERVVCRMFVGTWNVGGKSPNEELNLKDWLMLPSPAEIYVIGYVFLSFPIIFRIFAASYSHHHLCSVCFFFFCTFLFIYSLQGDIFSFNNHKPYPHNYCQFFTNSKYSIQLVSVTESDPEFQMRKYR